MRWNALTLPIQPKFWGLCLLAVALTCATSAAEPQPLSDGGQASPSPIATVLSESFESWPPPGWVLSPDAQTGGVWDSVNHPAGCSLGASYPYTNNTGGSGLCADANSDCNGDGMDTTMVTPSFSLASPSYISAQLQFKSDFFCAANLDEGWVDITTDNGAVWTNLLYFDHQSVRGPNTQTIDLTPYLGHSDVRLAFEYSAPGWDWYWQVDDVVVTAVQQGICTLGCSATVPASASTGTLLAFSAMATPSEGCAGTLSFAWTFGDGGTSTQQNPSHTYAAGGSYPWTMTVTVNGQSCSKNGTITISGPPPTLTATAQADHTSGTAPLAVTFTGSASGGVPPYAWAWTLGDGTTSTLQTPTHTYTQAGSFTAILTVTDSASHSAQASGITITVSAPPPPLVATAGSDKTSGTAPLAVAFTGSASGGTGAGYSYDWNFGDGSAHSSTQSLAHTYSAAGTFHVTLTVTDSGAHTATDTHLTITVSSAVAPPIIGLIKKASPPFKLVVTGSNLQNGIKVYIDGVQWGSVVWKSVTKIQLIGGASLKAAVPKGVTKTFRFVNLDGGESSMTWSW